MLKLFGRIRLCEITDGTNFICVECKIFVCSNKTNLNIRDHFSKFNGKLSALEMWHFDIEKSGIRIICIYKLGFDKLKNVCYSRKSVYLFEASATFNSCFKLFNSDRFIINK